MTQLRFSYEFPRRGAGTTRAFGDFDMAYRGWVIEGELYPRNNGTKIDWFRSRMLVDILIICNLSIEPFDKSTRKTQKF